MYIGEDLEINPLINIICCCHRDLDCNERDTGLFCKLFCLNFHLKTELGPKIRKKFGENFFFLDKTLFFVEKQKVLKFVGLESKISGLRGLFTYGTRMS